MMPDALQVAPQVVSVVLENDRIRVLDFKFRKGDKTAMHSHPANFVYALETGTFRSTSPDGKSTTVTMKKGDSSFSERNTHSVEYLTSGELLQVELK
jgi:beta-alanine degradation protein BauB